MMSEHSTLNQASKHTEWNECLQIGMVLAGSPCLNGLVQIRQWVVSKKMGLSIENI